MLLYNNNERETGQQKMIQYRITCEANALRQNVSQIHEQDNEGVKPLIVGEASR